ncbi:MAG TPA: hypothetical protein VIY29_09710, partial [Ktedonobacteraceae bacterium]
GIVPSSHALNLHCVLQEVQEMAERGKVTQVDQKAREPCPAKIRMLYRIHFEVVTFNGLLRLLHRCHPDADPFQKSIAECSG